MRSENVCVVLHVLKQCIRKKEGGYENYGELAHKRFAKIPQVRQN